MADEFGGEIPIGPFALIGGDEIGEPEPLASDQIDALHRRYQDHYGQR